MVLPMVKRMLVVEDDQDIASLIEMNMVDLGFEVTLCSHGTKGFNLATAESFDFIILDIMLPGMDGVEICKKLREQNNSVPILMLTARAAEIDRVIGLEAGADDYLTKPFSISELQARVKARVRRRDGTMGSKEEMAKDDDESIRAGELHIDAKRRKVLAGGKEVYLTAKEFDLLYFFASHPGRVFKREQLLDQVWGYGFDGYDHTVNSHINRLRNKIEPDPANPSYILTVWGVGYRFAEISEL